MKPAAPMLADNYVETTDFEWDLTHHFLAMRRLERIKSGELPTSEMLEELEDWFVEAFVYFCGMTWEDQQRRAPKFKETLERLGEMKADLRKRALRYLERAKKGRAEMAGKN